MFCKIIEEVSREPLAEILFEKNGRKTKCDLGKVFIYSLGGI
jgi:hypothetical protein